MISFVAAEKFKLFALCQENVMNILHAGYTAKVNRKCRYPAVGFGLAHSECRNTEGCKI